MKNKELSDLINGSKKILITSHISPDPDSIGSLLFVYGILKENFPEKEVFAVVEDSFPSFNSFLRYFDEVLHENLVVKVKEVSPDLILMLDGNKFNRFSRNESEELQNIMKEEGIKTVMIDHHIPDGRSGVDLYINNSCSSTAEEVYKIFKEDLKLRLFGESVDPVMFGILGDTGRFLYANNGHRETFRTVSELIDGGASIEKIQGKIGLLTLEQTKMIAELLKNLSQRDEYNYSWIDDKFVEENIKGKISAAEYNTAYTLFADQYLRSVMPCNWGVVIAPDFESGEKGRYRGSFRASHGVIDTSIFAKVLGGGGHKPASGFNVTATDYKEALEIVHNTIKDNLEEALKNA